MNVLVVPTNRVRNIREFLAFWRRKGGDDWDALVVVEDGPEKTFELGVPHHYSWREIDATFPHPEIITRRSSAIRSFGFWVAHQLGAEHIFTLDDDCLPCDGLFCSRHLHNLYNTPKWTHLIPGMRTRGMPYLDTGVLGNVVANVGLWSGVPDLDAIQSLSPAGVPTDFSPPPGDRVIPAGQYFPWTGMNFCFKREMMPLALFHQALSYQRFDDIWFGVVCKKVLDHLGLRVTVGHPWVYHNRASDTMTNLVREAPGVAANEWFWRVVDGVQLKGTTCGECALEMGEHLKRQEDTYVQRLGRALSLWAGLFV